MAEVVRDAEASSKAVVKGGDGERTALRGSTRLLRRRRRRGARIAREALRRPTRVGSRVTEPAAESLLNRRFARLLPHDADNAGAFAAIAPAEKRLVVEMGETAQRLATRYPGQAESMIRGLGTEGLTAVRVFGDDVAEVVVKEGPASLGVLRKTGRGGWSFFTREVLPHKKKLAAAGVLTAFLADPDKFVHYASHAGGIRRPRIRVRGRSTRRGRRRRLQAKGLETSIGAGHRPLRPELRRLPLCRHGAGEPGGGGRVAGVARLAGALDVEAGGRAGEVDLEESWDGSTGRSMTRRFHMRGRPIEIDIIGYDADGKSVLFVDVKATALDDKEVGWMSDDIWIASRRRPADFGMVVDLNRIRIAKLTGGDGGNGAAS